jgi:hypothetical protein
VTDRLRVNKLVLKIASWVTSAVARRVELDNLVIPPALAARAAVFAFGDELLDLRLPDDGDAISPGQWLSPGGRDFAAAKLLPRAEAALRQQRLADAAAAERSSAFSNAPAARANPVRRPSACAAHPPSEQASGTKREPLPLLRVRPRRKHKRRLTSLS